MLILQSTDILRVVTGSAADVEVYAAWQDYDSAAAVNDRMTPSRTPTASIVTATTTTVVASPASGVKRNIKTMTLTNNHATAASTVAVEFYDGSISERIIAVNLLAGENLMLDDKGTWTHYDVNGAKYDNSLVGRYLGTTVLTSGTSFTTKNDTRTVFIRVQGGGGGGGGCTSVAAAGAGAGGGGAGSYAEKTFAVTGNTAYAYTIGGAGAGASGAAGGNGGNSTFVVGGTTVTAFGGTGGPQAVTGTAVKTYAGGAGGIIPTNGDVNVGGEPGCYGVCILIAGPIVASGAGGSSEFGAGGLGIILAANGLNAVGFGAGGSGSATGASAVRTGGNGGAGCIVVDEYS